MEYKIEKHVPIPTHRGKGITDTLRKLKVGDSFIIPLEQRNSLYPPSYRLKIKISVRTAENGFRVWRIK